MFDVKDPSANFIQCITNHMTIFFIFFLISNILHYNVDITCRLQLNFTQYTTTYNTTATNKIILLIFQKLDDTVCHKFGKSTNSKL